MHSRLLNHPAYLCGQNKHPHFVSIDPVKSSQHGQGGQHPPGVAHIRELLWPTIKASRGQLPLAQPPSQEVTINSV